MSVKPQTFLRSLFLIPYLVWGIAFLFMTLLSKSPVNADPSNGLSNLPGRLAAVFGFDIVGWVRASPEVRVEAEPGQG